MPAAATPAITLPANLNYEDDDGLGWSLLRHATNPDEIFAGAVITRPSRRQISPTAPGSPDTFAASISANTFSLYSAGHDRFGRTTSVSSAVTTVIIVHLLRPHRLLAHQAASPSMTGSHPRQARCCTPGKDVTYSNHEAQKAIAALTKYQGAEGGEIGAALAVVGLSSARAAKEVGIRDDMIRVAHRCGASVRQISDVSGPDRKTVAAIIAPSVSADRSA